MPCRVGELRYLDFDLQETWTAQLLQTFPRLDRRLVASTTSRSTSPEGRADPLIYQKTYDYQRAEPWFDVGLQVLAAAGWRPDCALDTPVNLSKNLPPEDSAGFIIVEPSELMRFTEASRRPGYQSWMGSPAKDVDVTVGGFLQ